MSDFLTDSKRSFAPLVDSGTCVLLLGSLPGDKSLLAQRYYGNPRNQFWRLMGEVIEADLENAAYHERIAILKQAGVGLWDVIQSADRRGSLDAAIRNHQPNALQDLIATLPCLRAVAFNGATAARLGRRELGAAGAFAFVDLPSSSPALTLPFAQKLTSWLQLRHWLPCQAADAKP